MTIDQQKDPKGSADESWWRLGPWLLAFALGGIIVCWVAGLLGVLVLGEPFGLDLQGYREPESAGAEDHVRYVVLGGVILGIVWGGIVTFERVSNWLGARRRQREMNAHDLAQYRREEEERVATGISKPGDDGS